MYMQHTTFNHVYQCHSSTQANRAGNNSQYIYRQTETGSQHLTCLLSHTFKQRSFVFYIQSTTNMKQLTQRFKFDNRT